MLWDCFLGALGSLRAGELGVIKSRAVHYEGDRQKGSGLVCRRTGGKRQRTEEWKTQPACVPISFRKASFQQAPGLFVPNTLPFLSVPCLAVA